MLKSDVMIIFFVFIVSIVNAKSKATLKKEIKPEEGGKRLNEKDALKAFKMNLISNFNLGPLHCFNNWIQLPDYHSCYGIFYENVTWDNARDTCRDFGGHLATFDSLKELQDVSDQIINKTMTGIYHTGYIKSNGFEDVLTAESFSAKHWFDQTPYVNIAKTEDETNFCGVVNKSNALPNVSTPYLVKCGSDDYDNNTKHYFICKLPDEQCLCSKMNEPVLRNFEGTYFNLEDQTEYILLQYQSNAITMLLWQNETTVINSTQYKPDSSLPVSLIRLIVANKTTYSLTKQNNTIKLFVNSSCKADNLVNVNYTDTNILFNTSVYKSVIMLTTDKKVQILYDGRNMVMSVDIALARKGLCGNCSRKIDKTNHWIADDKITNNKNEWSQLWIHPRIQWPSQAPNIETCTSAILRQAAATVCRSLFDITMCFGSCLSSNAKVRSYMEKVTFRLCMKRVCEGGPASACQFYEYLAKKCKFNDTFRDTFGCNKTKPCPKNYIYNSNGFCYFIAQETENNPNSFLKYFPLLNSSKLPLPWYSAMELCFRRGAQLASITSISDQLFIHYFIRSKLKDDEDLWIGAIADSVRQASFWTDGSAMTFEAWDTDARNWSYNINWRCAAFTFNNSWTLTDCSGNKTHAANPTAALCSIRSYAPVICSGFPCSSPKECIDGACKLPSIKVEYCVPNPCMNSGTCKTKGYAGSGYMCLCLPNIFGARCERTRDTLDISMIPVEDKSLVNTNLIKASRPCPSPEWFEVDNGNCYMVMTEKVAWETARESCRDYGGYLTVLNTQDEMSKIAEIANDLANGMYHVGYISIDGKKSFESTPAGLSQYIDSYLSGLVSDGCAVANPSTGSFMFRKCSNANSPDAGYICERDTKRCTCGKWNEPVVRTFNGESVTVVNNTEYLLFMVPWKFSVSILIRENNLGFITYTQYLPDVVPSVEMIVVEFYEYNTLCYIKSDQKKFIISNCVGDADKITFNLFPLVNPTTLIMSALDGNLTIFYDGVNVELSVDYRIAQKSKPGTGLCGMCDDRQRDQLFSPSQMEVDDKRQFVDSWVVGRDIWPSTQKRILSCVSATMQESASARCSLFIDISDDISGLCLISNAVPQDILAYLYENCMTSVCQYGPGGACQYFDQLITLCNLNKSASMAKLKCDNYDWCQNTTVSPTGRCYFKSDIILSWTEAQSYCHSKSANLAIISDKDEFDFISDLIPKQLWYNCWLGAILEPNYFTTWWDDGTEFNVANFWSAGNLLHNNFTCIYSNGISVSNKENCLAYKNYALCSFFVGDICGDKRCYLGQICTGGGICTSNINFQDCGKYPYKNMGACKDGSCSSPSNRVGKFCQDLDPNLASPVTLPPEIMEVPVDAMTSIDEPSEPSDEG